MCAATDKAMAARQYDLAPPHSVESYGWAIQGVVGSRDPHDRAPVFSYAIGLSTMGLPELAIFDVSVRSGAGILNNVAARLAAGEPIRPGSALARVIVGPDPVIAIAMTDTIELLALSSIYSGVDDALQIVWPDRAGRHPWDEAWSLGGEQPLHGPPPVTGR